MDESAKAKRFDAIDYEATRQKIIVHFIESIYDQNPEIFRAVFLLDDEGVDLNNPEAVDTIVFGGLASEIKDLEKMAIDLPSFGIASVHDALVRLGWLDTIPDVSPDVVRVIGITELGRDIVNGYRSVQGLRLLE